MGYGAPALNTVYLCYKVNMVALLAKEGRYPWGILPPQHTA